MILLTCVVWVIYATTIRCDPEVVYAYDIPILSHFLPSIFTGQKEQKAPVETVWYFPLMYKGYFPSGDPCASVRRPPGGDDAATVTVCPGEATLITDEIVFRNFSKVGYDYRAYAYEEWHVTDARGMGDGWRIDIGKSECFNGLGFPANGASFYAKLSPGNIHTVNGNDPPQSSMTAYTNIGSNDNFPNGLNRIMLYARPGSGMGTYVFVPEFQLYLPHRPLTNKYTCTLELLLSPGKTP